MANTYSYLEKMYNRNQIDSNNSLFAFGVLLLVGIICYWLFSSNNKETIKELVNRSNVSAKVLSKAIADLTAYCNKKGTEVDTRWFDKIYYDKNKKQIVFEYVIKYIPINSSYIYKALVSKGEVKLITYPEGKTSDKFFGEPKTDETKQALDVIYKKGVPIRPFGITILCKQSEYYVEEILSPGSVKTFIVDKESGKIRDLNVNKRLCDIGDCKMF